MKATSWTCRTCGAPERDGVIVLRVESGDAAAPDELGALARFAKDWGLELRGLKSAAKRAGVPLVRIGRQTCARRSDLLRIAGLLAAEPEVERSPGVSTPRPAATTYEDLVAQARARPTRKARKATKR